MAKKIEKTSEELRTEACGLIAQAQTALDTYGQRRSTWFGKLNSERANDTMIDETPIADMQKKVEDAQKSNVVVRFFRRLFTSYKKQESLFYSIKIKTAFQALNTTELTTGILSSVQSSLEDINQHLSWFSGVQTPLNLLNRAQALMTQSLQMDMDRKKAALDSKVKAVPAPDEVVKRNDATLTLEWDCFVRALTPEDWGIYRHFNHWPADKFMFLKRMDRSFSSFISEPENHEQYYQETLLPKYQSTTSTNTKKASAANKATQWFGQRLAHHLEEYKQEHECVYNKTQLFRAIKANDLARVKKIIELSKDDHLLYGEINGENAFHLACRLGRLDIAKHIHTTNCTLSRLLTDDHEYPLTLALRTKNLDLVKYLVENCGEKPRPKVFSSDDNEGFVRAALESAHLPTITYLLEKFPFLCSYLPKLIREAKNNPTFEKHISHLHYLYGNYLINHAKEQWWKGDDHFRKVGLQPAFKAALAQYNLAIKKDKKNETPNVDYYVARMNVRLKVDGLSNDMANSAAFKSIQNDYGVLFKQKFTLDADTYVTLILAKIQQKHFKAAQTIMDEAFTHHSNEGMLSYLNFYLYINTNQQEKPKHNTLALPTLKEFYQMISCFPWLITDIFQHENLNPKIKNDTIALLNTYHTIYGQSLLHMACELEDVRLANALLTAGVGYVDSSCFNNSPLEHAAQLGRDTMVTLICKKQRYTDEHMEKAIEQTLETGTPQTLDILLDHAKPLHLTNEKLQAWIAQAKVSEQPEKEASLLNKIIGKLTALQEKYVHTKQLFNGKPLKTLFFAQEKQKTASVKNPENAYGHRRALSMEL